VDPRKVEPQGKEENRRGRAALELRTTDTAYSVPLIGMLGVRSDFMGREGHNYTASRFPSPNPTTQGGGGGSCNATRSMSDLELHPITVGFPDFPSPLPLFQSRRVSHNAVRFAGIFSTVSSRPNSAGRSQAVSSSQPDIIPIFTKFPKFCSPCWVLSTLGRPCQIGGDQAPTLNSSQPTALTSNPPP
jgi:hypothetical protein